jgi:hypothetical protein
MNTSLAADHVIRHLPSKEKLAKVARGTATTALRRPSGKCQKYLTGLNWLNVAYKPNFWL